MSDTPRTDTAEGINNRSDYCRKDFARQLERELDAALAQNAAMRDAIFMAHESYELAFLTRNNPIFDALESALASDAGKDYVPKSEVENGFRMGVSTGRDNQFTDTDTDTLWIRARRVVEGDSKL